MPCRRNTNLCNSHQTHTKVLQLRFSTNKGDVKKYSSALQEIIPRLFGEHENRDAWCGFNKNPGTYKHRGLPYGNFLWHNS